MISLFSSFFQCLADSPPPASISFFLLPSSGARLCVCVCVSVCVCVCVVAVHWVAGRVGTQLARLAPA